MKIVFAGQVIADDYAVSCDAVSGVVISGQQSNQAAEFIRADWAQSWSRGNRKHTLPFHHIRPPKSAPSEAFLEMLTWFANLPQEGVLQLIEDDVSVTFAAATIESFRSERKGVTWSYDVTFSCYAPAVGSLQPRLLLVDGGSLLLVDGGNLVLEN